MNKKLKKLLPRSYRQYLNWAERGFRDPAPQEAKERIFEAFGIANAPWVETGTYLGTTTQYLSEHFPRVYSVEPEPSLYKRAKESLNGAKVKLFNNVSEVVFPELLPTLSGDLNFWLDGHYSGGTTFQGEQDCPVVEELACIAENLSRFDKVAILIDDLRCFYPDSTEYPDYPSADFLVDWAREHGFQWRTEHDIFIMRRA